jgi:UDP-galactopyranose mutase
VESITLSGRQKQKFLWYAEYKRLADTEKNVIFGGRLAEYRYYDMDAVIASALKKSEEVL